MHESKRETLDHIAKVESYLSLIAHELRARGAGWRIRRTRAGGAGGRGASMTIDPLWALVAFCAFVLIGEWIDRVSGAEE